MFVEEIYQPSVQRYLQVKSILFNYMGRRLRFEILYNFKEEELEQQKKYLDQKLEQIRWVDNPVSYTHLMFKKILVPVDGSETAWRALNNALEIGKKFESEILVVNVIQPYNNAALLAVPLDHATINQGNSELEKVGDKVLELAKEMVGSLSLIHI